MTVGVDLLWTKMINPQLVDLKEGLISLKQAPEDLHLNHNGDMHASVLFSMVEMAGMGCIVMQMGSLAQSSLVVVKSVNIDFIKRAQGEITFTGRIDVDQQARILALADSEQKVEEVVMVEARNQAGDIVSRAQVTAVISPQ